MRRAKKTISITKRNIARAARKAFIGHNGKREIEAFKKNFNERVEELWTWWNTGEWEQHISYRQLEKDCTNGKHRQIDCPSLTTRIYQILFIQKVRPMYIQRDHGHRMNCKKGFGITATDKRRSVLSRLKHVYYDRRDLQWLVYLDQRKCYAHILPSVFIKAMRRLTTDERFIHFAVSVCFVGDRLPIGTPSSPVAHHIVMLPFEQWIETFCPYHIGYADDDVLFFHTKEEAQQALWRCKQFLWYELHLRAKNTTRVQSLDLPLDFCGFVIKRNEPHADGHDKGFSTLRKSTMRRADAATRKSWPSFFGRLKACDGYRAMLIIQDKMKLQDLTDKIRIDRSLDARNIDVKELVGQPITISDYDMRRDGKGNVNWIKFLVGIPERDNDGRLTGKTLAREFHGNYAGLYSYILEVEKVYRKSEVLPITEAVIVNQCGYIFRGSTNQMEYLPD